MVQRWFTTVSEEDYDFVEDKTQQKQESGETAEERDRDQPSAPAENSM